MKTIKDKDGFQFHYTEIDKCPSCNEPLQPMAKLGDGWRYYCSKCVRVIKSDRELK